MTPDSISTYMHALCKMDKFGGRCTRTNDCTWEVLDVTQWSESQQNALRSKFPRIAARVVTNRKSLSGFSLTLTLQKAPRMWTSLLACAVMVTATLTIARSFRI
jgi:hypothetical protein